MEILGLGYFTGNEIMIFVIGVALYGAIPWGTMWWAVKHSSDRCYVLAVSVISLAAVYVFKAVFTFVFSEAGMEQVFQGRFQLRMLSVLFVFWGLWQLRQRIHKKTALLWLVTAACGVVAGAAALVCLVLAVDLYIFYNFWTVGRSPHADPAAGVVVVLMVACWLAALAVTLSLHQQETRARGKVVFITLSAVSFIGAAVRVWQNYILL